MFSEAIERTYQEVSISKLFRVNDPAQNQRIECNIKNGEADLLPRFLWYMIQANKEEFPMIFEKSGGAVDWLIVGLGNPGQKYEHTRHNMGFLTVDLLAEQLNVKLNKVKFKSAYNIVRFAGPEVPGDEAADLYEPLRRGCA